MVNRRFLFWFIFLLTVLLLIIEAYFYPNFWQIRVGVPIFLITGTSLLVITCLGWTSSSRHHLELINLVSLTTILGAISSLLVIYEQTNFPNAVFSRFHFNLESVQFIPLYAWCVTLLTYTKYLVTKKPVAYFGLPFLLVGLLIFLRLNYEPLFPIIGMEDSIIEWCSFLFFLLAVPFAAKIALLPGKQHHYQRLFFLILAAGLFFLAGEEISWGERVFNFVPHDFFQAYNAQQEITVHNIDVIQKKLFYAYISIGSWGSFGWLVDMYLRPKHLQNSLHRLVPPWFISSFFMYLLWYGINRVVIGPLHYKTWEETAELVFAMGMFLFVATHSSSPLRHYFPTINRSKKGQQ